MPAWSASKSGWTSCRPDQGFAEAVIPERRSLIRKTVELFVEAIETLFHLGAHLAQEDQRVIFRFVSQGALLYSINRTP
jgi:hypothetical protein